MFVGIPVVEMDDFFKMGENLPSFLELLSKAFDIKYSLATNEEIEEIEIGKCIYIKAKTDAIFIRIHTDERLTNKYFNVAYNIMRYLWYKHYTPMAIIATNLWRLGIITDPMDVLAIAHSYQNGNNRAVLPESTIQKPGLLFFRPKADVVIELKTNQLFNSIFYKYPIFFDPQVNVSGSFFEEEKVVIKAKEVINRMIGVMDVTDIPRQVKKNIDLIYADYVKMRQSYLSIIGVMDSNNYFLSKESPILLSIDMAPRNVSVITPTGNGKNLYLTTDDDKNPILLLSKPKPEPKVQEQVVTDLKI